MDLRDEKPFQLLGARVGNVQDKLLVEEAPDRFQMGYRRFLLSIDRETYPARWRAAFCWAAGLSVAAAAAFAFWWTAAARPTVLSFKVGSERTPGIVGEWITAPSSQSIPVAFSDGTWVDLEPNTRARIGLQDTQVRRIVIESGSARVHVVHRDRVRWRVDAGPFAVHVTGTAFNVNWAPDSQLFEVALREGVVIVDGPVLDKGQTVRKGQTLRVSVTRPMALLADASSLPSYREWARHLNAEAEPEAGRATESDSTHEVTHTSTTRGRADTLDGRWKELADEGHYEEALAAAEGRGFRHLCRRLGAASLLRLAEVARFAGRVDRAEQALLLLRERFPKRRESAIAAYTLGRAAFDQKGAYAEAGKWFETYLRQQPSGPLAREALGRLIEAQDRQGRHDKAKQTARRYLERYPDGPHTDIASRLIAQ